MVIIPILKNHFTVQTIVFRFTNIIAAQGFGMKIAFEEKSF